MKNKHLILVIAISLFLIAITAFLIYKNGNYQKKLINYISDKGYIKDVGTLYTKESEKFPLISCAGEIVDENCKGIQWYFDVESHDFYQKKVWRINSTEFIFLPIYNYKNEEYKFTARVYFKNGNIFLKGNYNSETQDFACDVEFAYNLETKKYSEKLCKSFELDIKEFEVDVKEFITSTSMLRKMKNNK